MGQKLLKWWTDFRTSWTYVYLFILFCTIWITIELFTGFDPEYTRLNLIISLMTELQSIILLIYAKSIARRNEQKDKIEYQRINEINHKLDKIMKDVYNIHENIEDISEDIEEIKEDDD